MFKGRDYVDQLNLILGILGTPGDDVLTRIASDRAESVCFCKRLIVAVYQELAETPADRV
jgi:hypothetical protein